VPASGRDFSTSTTRERMLYRVQKKFCTGMLANGFRRSDSLKNERIGRA
jgi:hypothetical protein